MQEIINALNVKVKSRFEGESSGHDYWHIYRVWQLSKLIASKEPGADMFIVEAGALLHDIADWKFHDGDDDAGPREARKILEKLKVDKEIILKIEDLIKHISFKGAEVNVPKNNIETKIVSDADKLDAMGAIGIARTFAYGGHKNRPMYDPGVKHTVHKTFDEYKTSQTHTINHFYEKLLLLKDHMQTDTGKALAQKRHKYMEDFLKEFYAEWNIT